MFFLKHGVQESEQGCPGTGLGWREEFLIYLIFLDINDMFRF